MREAYLIAAGKGEVLSLSIHSHAGQVSPILRELFQKSGLPARRVQALHWYGGEQDFWLPSLDRTTSAGEPQSPALGFLPEMARFQWPAAALLAHAGLQSAARAIEAGDADVIVLAQEAGEQAVALLLASPTPVGIYNLSPLAVIRQKLALSSKPAGLLNAACAALQKARQEAAAQEDAQREAAEQEPANPSAVEIQWLAAAKRLEPPPGAVSSGGIFPGARWLNPGGDVPAGDFFLLQALADRLKVEKAQRGLLLSQGPQKSGLATLLERV